MRLYSIRAIDARTFDLLDPFYQRFGPKDALGRESLLMSAMGRKRNVRNG